MSDIFAPAAGTGGDTFAPAQFSGIIGEGALSVTSPALSGAGRAAASITGTANFAVTSPVVTASGNAFAVITGFGSLTATTVALGGYGAVAPGYQGLGTLFTRTVAVAGAGEVTYPALPEIVDNGDLTISIPYYGQAVALDYPDIAAWLAGFVSTAPVTNNAPFVIQSTGQPVPVTFTASNQFGSTSITRYLVIQQLPDTGTLVPNQADLRLNYPYFDNPVLFTYRQLEEAIGLAQCHISASNYGRLNGAARLRAIYLMTAHMLYIQQQAATGGNVALVSGSAVDKVSVQLTPPPLKTQWQWWLSTSPYGSELMALLSVKSVGGFYIPGSLSRGGFRKADGSF